MVLVKNNGDKDINLSWGPYDYRIKVGGTLENVPASVIKAMQDRYTGIEIVKSENVPCETIEQPEELVATEMKVEENVVEATIEVKKKPRQRKGSDTLNQIA